MDSTKQVQLQRLRNAARLAINAEHSFDFGVLVTLAFSCLEGLLVDRSKEDVLAKLSEAVAHSLGKTHEERRRLRKRVKVLYDIRSAFVHTGGAAERAGERREVIELLYRVLRREIDLLPDAEG